MKKIICLFCLVLSLFAEETLEISAKKFFSDDKNGITRIQGDVHIKKSKDTLEADQVVIYTDKDRKPISYEAEGNVKFHIFMQDGREIKGHSDRLIYESKTGEYRLLENAVLKEVGKENTIRGEEIVVNNENGYANVLGSDSKPAKFIFNLDDVSVSKKPSSAKSSRSSKNKSDTSPEEIQKDKNTQDMLSDPSKTIIPPQGNQ
ncbi:lipopolysaccharide transport periplasmic protein LptA [Helicobacter sp. 13S00482-2]|uniref:lipopolysaccharide transport periplasmic protein LptA n=1 Tax=Helicobacter sp. 13S00482-2 TaxID=1476200 RepID=UPI000BA63108|nr:lipopolysaccharide transport periplasmic protein LptA [Helicobacter sp. 13S00482-2]PAF54435.1 lipopolysaccharide transport periplasmic protein LptA [Helicobacter sp. 13S00482-2]